MKLNNNYIFLIGKFDTEYCFMMFMMMSGLGRGWKAASKMECHDPVNNLVQGVNCIEVIGLRYTNKLGIIVRKREDNS